MVERACGNYAGVCRLGRVDAHEMNLRVMRVTFFTGIAECEVPKIFGVRRR